MTARIRLTAAQRAALIDAIDNGGFIYAVAMRAEVRDRLVHKGALRLDGHCYRVTDAGRHAALMTAPKLTEAQRVLFAMTAPKLTEAQRRALAAIQATPAWANVDTRVRRTLRRQGLTMFGEGPSPRTGIVCAGEVITDAGRAALRGES